MAFRFTPKILFIYYIFKNFIFIFIFYEDSISFQIMIFIILLVA